MSHPSVSTRIGQILAQTSNEKTKYFALTILENIIKRQWSSVSQDHKRSLLHLLLTSIGMAPNQQPLGQAPPPLLRKKTCALVAQILVREWTDTQQPHGIDALILQAHQNPSTSVAFVAIIQELATYYKRQMAATDHTPTAQDTRVFSALFSECLAVAKVAATQPANDALLAMTALFELIEVATLLSSFNLLIDKITTNYFRGTCVLALMEYVSVLSTTTAQYDRATIIPQLFQAIIQALATIVPTTHKDIKKFFLTHGILSANLASLLTLLYRSFTPIVEANLPQLRDAQLLGERQIILLAWIDDSTIYLNCLEYWSLKFQEILKEQPLMSQIASPLATSDRVALNADLAEPICRVIYKILKTSDRDIIEETNSPVKGILYHKSHDAISTSEEWQPLSAMLNETFGTIAQLYPMQCYSFFVNRLIRISGSQDLFTSSKFSSICWCLGYCLNSMRSSEKFEKMLGDLYGFRDPFGGEYQELVYSSILYIIRGATNYLESPQQKISTTIQLLFQWIQAPPSPTFLDITLHTLLVVLQQRGPHILTEYGDLHKNLNQFIGLPTMSSDNKKILYECIGSVFYAHKLAGRGLPVSYITEITDPLNRMLHAKQLNDNDIIEWSANINATLSFNNTLARASKDTIELQVKTIIPDLLELYKWTTQPNSNQFYFNHQIAIKKMIVELIDTYTLCCRRDDAYFIERVLIPLFTLMVEDKSLATVSSMSTFLPKAIELLSTVFGAVGNAIPQNVSSYIVTFFLAPSLVECASQGSKSQGQILIGRVFTLVKVLLNNAISTLTSDLIVNELMQLSTFESFDRLLKKMILSMGS
eukprot:gene8232-9679_t